MSTTTGIPPEPKSLIFMGGIADSGKSVLIEQVIGYASDVRAFAVSDFLKDTLATKSYPLKGDRLGPEVTLIDWKSHEPEAIEKLCGEVQACFNEPSVRTVIVNTHFATYSPGGFMIGLDPNSIELICRACKLLESEQPTSKHSTQAAVVLVDIGIADVLHRREKRWTTSVDTFTIGAALAQDLESNRVYALHYYTILKAILGRKRVVYHRLFVDYKSQMHLSNELLQVPEFILALNDFAEWLKRESFTGNHKKWHA